MEESAAEHRQSGVFSRAEFFRRKNPKVTIEKTVMFKVPEETDSQSIIIEIIINSLETVEEIINCLSVAYLDLSNAPTLSIVDKSLSKSKGSLFSKVSNLLKK